MKKTMIMTILVVFSVMDIHAQNVRVGDDQNVSSGYLEPINVEGEFRRKQAQEESLDKKLNRQNQRMNRKIKKKIIEKQIEFNRVIEEKIEKTLEEKIFMGGENSKKETFDSTSPKTQTKFSSEAKALLVLEKTPDFDESSKLSDNVEIVPYLGVMNISGDGMDLDSRLNFGIAFESMVSNVVRVGIDFNYSELKMESLDEFNAVLYQRDIDYRRLGLDIGVKMFLFSPDVSKINPFLGVSLGYSNSNLEYVYLPSIESFVSNAFVASAIVGAEIAFNNEFGINLAVKFSRGLAENSDTTFSYNDNQNRLNRIGRSIEDADYTTLNGGLVLKF